MSGWVEPDWSQRLPGEQWVILDSPQSAEFYLNQLPSETIIIREEYPNPDRLYAQFSAPGQIFRNRLYVPFN